VAKDFEIIPVVRIIKTQACTLSWQYFKS